MGNSDAKLLLIGLDNSGKTTILSRLISPSSYDPNITPTIGFKKDTFTRQGIDFQVFDMSGQSKYRDLWQANVGTGTSNQKLDGIIFVIDSSDKMRINVARSQLQMIVQNERISKNTPYLFYSNKGDIKGACPVNQVQQILKLKEILKDRKYFITGCCGISGKGIEEGMSWLVQKIKPYKQ